MMRSLVSGTVKSLRRNDLFWRHVFNRDAVREFKMSGDSVRGIESDILEKLETDGFVRLSVDELFPGENILEKLQADYQVVSAPINNEIERLRLHADDLATVGEKKYSLELFGSEVKFKPESFTARLALSERFLRIADNYYGMATKLRYYNFWHTLPTTTAARESQLWHFDREDNYILKVFVYLTDVDEGAGPFTYAPGTHRKGKFNGLRPEQFNEQGVLRSTDEQMAAVFPREKWIRATGQAGTVIFADTRGFHKGGEARTSERILFTSMYTSPASQSRRLLEVPPDADLASLSPLQRRALPA